MKKLISILLLLALAFQPIGFSAWNTDLPGFTLLSDLDARVTENYDAAEALLQVPVSFQNLKATTSGSATTVTVTANSLILNTTSLISYMATSVSESIAITTSGASGLVSSLSEAANTIYYVWIARKSSDGTTNGYLSTTTSLTTFLTQVDSGYDQAALVSVVGNDGSSNFLDFTQEGREYWFATWKTVITGTQSGWGTLDMTPSTLSFFVPTSLSTLCRGTYWKPGSTGQYTGISNSNSVAADGTNTANKFVNGEGSDIASAWELNIITTDTIYWFAGGTSTVYLSGFTLNLL